MAPSILAFDIETYGSWERLSPRMQVYLEERDRARGRDPADPKAAPRAVSLLPGLAQVVAVGLWPERGPATSLALDPRQEPRERVVEGESHRLVFFQRERDLLEAFWTRVDAAVRGGSRLVSFSGKSFDGPMLALRSAVLGLRPSLDLCGPRHALQPHCDVADVLTLFGATYQRLSLDYWCEVFDLASPKEHLNGREVGAAFERHDHTEIAEYALRDARAAGELFLRVHEALVAPREERRAPPAPPPPPPPPPRERGLLARIRRLRSAL